MHYLTGKHVPRRTFLRSLGASVALPMLDAMLPAGRLWGSVAKEITGRPRLIAIEQVHGVAGSAGLGTKLDLWDPIGVGREFDLSGSSMLPLDPYREHATIITGTDVKMADAFSSPEIGGDHFRSSAVFLTHQHPRQTEGSDVFVGKSLDQIFADRFGQDTPIPSLQLCIENIDQSGGCAYGYSCVYTDSISWRSPDEPLPMIRDPRIIFDQLFGSGGTPEERARRMRRTGSILDWISSEFGAFNRTLGTADQQRMDRYLESLREIERRIQQTVARNTSGEEREIPEAPGGVPDSFAEHVKILFDMQALAFESDLTRVFSLKLGRDSSNRVYSESGCGLPFHAASHHGDNEEGLRELALINKYHVSMLPHLLERLKTTMEGEESLLDQTAIIYGSPMGDPNIHNHNRCPLILLGGANGALEGGLHIRAQNGTPMANVMLSLLQGMGMNDMTSFGDSAGPFELRTPQ